MSIVTRTGDDGTTALMYGRRVAKHHPRVEAYGAVDEVNALLGVARASASDDFVRGHLLTTQKDLVAIMGELATAAEDLERYARDGYPRLEPSMIERLDQLASELERQGESPKDWVMPGANPCSAALDHARTVCRRAERRLSELQAADQLHNPNTMRYFNRLSDVLWLMARWTETRTGDQGRGSTR